MHILKSTSLIGLTLININSFAQDKQIVRLSVITPGIQLEQKLAKNQTLSLTGALDPRFALLKQDIGQPKNVYYFALRPTAALKYNYFHNLQSRAKKGKNTASNSGNYFTLGITTESNWGLEASNWEFDEDRPNTVCYIPLGYGIQRSVKEKFFYNIMAGGIYIPQFNQAYFALNIKMGYTLFKK